MALHQNRQRHRPGMTWPLFSQEELSDATARDGCVSGDAVALRRCYHAQRTVELDKMHSAISTLQRDARRGMSIAVARIIGAVTIAACGSSSSPSSTTTAAGGAGGISRGRKLHARPGNRHPRRHPHLVRNGLAPAELERHLRGLDLFAGAHAALQQTLRERFGDQGLAGFLR